MCLTCLIQLSDFSPLFATPTKIPDAKKSECSLNPGSMEPVFYLCSVMAEISKKKMRR
jgi:hypothetical protein